MAALKAHSIDARILDFLKFHPQASIRKITLESGLDLNTYQVAYHIGRLQGSGRVMVTVNPSSPGDVALWQVKIKYQRILLAHGEGIAQGVPL